MEDILAEMINRRKEFLEDLKNFYVGDFEQIKNPGMVLEKVLNVNELYANAYEQSKNISYSLEFQDHATELEMMEKVRAILSFYELKGLVGNNREENAFDITINGDVRMLTIFDGDEEEALVNKVRYWNIKDLPVMKRSPSGELCIANSIKDKNVYKELSFRFGNGHDISSYEFRILDSLQKGGHSISLRNLFSILDDDDRYVCGYEDMHTVRNALDIAAEHAEKQSGVNYTKMLADMLNDGIRSSFDADIVLETRREVDRMVNPPKWAKELPAAAVLTAFEAMRCVSDKDLEQLNDPENQKRFVQALKDATFRNAGHIGRETAYAVAGFFYPNCSQDLADTYVYAVYCTSTASHPHEIDTSLKTDEQLRSEVNRLAKMKSSQIIPKSERFSIPETYKLLERNGLTLAKTVANVNGAKLIAKQDLTEYIPKISLKDFCMAISKDKGEEYVGVIKFSPQKNRYDVLKSFGTKTGIEKLNALIDAVNEKMLEKKKGAKTVPFKEIKER